MYMYIHMHICIECVDIYTDTCIHIYIYIQYRLLSRAKGLTCHFGSGDMSSRLKRSTGSHPAMDGLLLRNLN